MARWAVEKPVDLAEQLSASLQLLPQKRARSTAAIQKSTRMRSGAGNGLQPFGTKNGETETLIGLGETLSQTTQGAGSPSERLPTASSPGSSGADTFDPGPLRWFEVSFSKAGPRRSVHCLAVTEKVLQ